MLGCGSNSSSLTGSRPNSTENKLIIVDFVDSRLYVNTSNTTTDIMVKNQSFVMFN